MRWFSLSFWSLAASQCPSALPYMWTIAVSLTLPLLWGFFRWTSTDCPNFLFTKTRSSSRINLSPGRSNTSAPVASSCPISSEESTSQLCGRLAWVSLGAPRGLSTDCSLISTQSIFCSSLSVPKISDCSDSSWPLIQWYPLPDSASLKLITRTFYGISANVSLYLNYLKQYFNNHSRK